MLLTCEHATSRLPRGLDATAAEREALASHWGWDLGGWGLTRELSRRLGATAVGGAWTRLWIDCNRAVDDPTLVRDEAGGTPLSWNRKISTGEIERRVRDVYAPYHAEVDRRIVGHLLRGVRPTILAVHTFTPTWDGRQRALDVGVLYREHSGPARRFGRALRETGLRMRWNEPYSGLAGMMYSAERHGTVHRLPCLELEVNQDLLRTPAAIRRVGEAVALAACRIL